MSTQVQPSLLDGETVIIDGHVLQSGDLISIRKGAPATLLYRSCRIHNGLVVVECRDTRNGASRPITLDRVVRVQPKAGRS